MFRGAMVALVTPMTESGEIDFLALERLIDYQLENNTKALIVNGTTGESPSISADEFDLLVGKTIAYVANRVPVIVGTGCNVTKTTIEKTKRAKELGADAVLLVAPYYNRPTQEGLYQHYSAVADAVGIDQILYNVPARTSCDLLPDTVAKLAKIRNVVAIKEASADLGRLNELLQKCPDTFDVLSGEDIGALDYLLNGAKGVISVTANVAPRLMSEMTESALAKEIEQAKMANNKLIDLHKNLFVEANPIPVKWALNAMGMIDAGIRLPLTWLSSQHQGKVANALVQAGIIESTNSVINS